VIAPRLRDLTKYVQLRMRKRTIRLFLLNAPQNDGANWETIGLCRVPRAERYLPGVSGWLARAKQVSP